MNIAASKPYSYALFPTPIGECGIAWRDELIVTTHLPERTASETEARLAAHTGGAAGMPTKPIQQIITAITDLLDGQHTDLREVNCDFSNLDQFAADVYEATRAIPPGQTTNYGKIAQDLGDKLLAQKVGQTLGRNPFPIIVPCHRVMGANNKLTGFSAHGGIETKLKMLLIEGARFSEEPGLFDDLPLNP